MKLEDFADAIRGELSEVRVPDAGDALLERIRRSRASGTRVILPLNDERPSRRPLFVVSAIAAAAIAVFFLGRTRDDGMPLPKSESWFGGDVALATTLAQSLPAARITLAERMHPMVVIYDRSIPDSAGVVRRTESQLTVARDSIDGAAAWRVVSRRTMEGGGVALDSVWVSASSFAPLRQTITQMPYRRYERITVWQRFSGLHATGEMNAILGGRLSARRFFDRSLPSDAMPYVPDAFVPLFHMGVAIDRNWSGRAAVLGWLVRDDNISVPISLRVDGEDVVRVPAGEFPSWRLAIEVVGTKRWYWIRKSDGLGVRMLDSTSVPGGVREIVLRSVTK